MWEERRFGVRVEYARTFKAFRSDRWTIQRYCEQSEHVCLQTFKLFLTNMLSERAPRFHQCPCWPLTQLTPKCKPKWSIFAFTFNPIPRWRLKFTDASPSCLWNVKLSIKQTFPSSAYVLLPLISRPKFPSAVKKQPMCSRLCGLEQVWWRPDSCWLPTIGPRHKFRLCRWYKCMGTMCIFWFSRNRKIRMWVGSSNVSASPYAVDIFPVSVAFTLPFKSSTNDIQMPTSSFCFFVTALASFVLAKHNLRGDANGISRSCMGDWDWVERIRFQEFSRSSRA